MISDAKVIELGVPVADAFAGTKTFPIVNMMHFGKCTFVLAVGANAGYGRVSCLIRAVDGSGPAFTGNTAIVPCRVRYGTNSTFGDTLGAVTAVSVASGTSLLTPEAMASTVMLIEVTQNDIVKSGLNGVVGLQLITNEIFDAAVTGTVLAVLENPGYGTQLSGWMCSGLTYDIRDN